MTLKPLKISCDDSDCKNDLHCFRVNKRKRSKFPKGHCQACGIDLVDWDRIQKKQLSDVRHTIDSLKVEWIRHYHWHGVLGEAAKTFARRKGMTGLRVAVNNHLRKAIGGEKPWRDGSQTPFGKDGGLPKNPIHAAQHAIAACCRKCVEYWHGIPRGRDLSEIELAYLTDLAMIYLREKLPDVHEGGQPIPLERS